MTSDANSSPTVHGTVIRINGVGGHSGQWPGTESARRGWAVLLGVYGAGVRTAHPRDVGAGYQVLDGESKTAKSEARSARLQMNNPARQMKPESRPTSRDRTTPATRSQSQSPTRSANQRTISGTIANTRTQMARAKRVLFVCEGNLHRSPTAERMCATIPGVKARSAGLSSLARVQVTVELLAWADIVFVMERRLKRLLRQRFGPLPEDKELICLNVPDDFQADQPELVVLLAERLAPHLGSSLRYRP